MKDRSVSDSRKISVATGASGVIVAQLPANGTLTGIRLTPDATSTAPVFASVFWNWSGSVGQTSTGIIFAFGWIRGLGVGAGEPLIWNGAFDWNIVDSPESQIACNVRNDTGSTQVVHLQWTVIKHSE